MIGDSRTREWAAASVFATPLRIRPSRVTTLTVAVLALAALAVSAGALAAQDTGLDRGGRYGSSILGLLPVSEQVEVGSELEGEFTDQDYTTVSGVRVKAYELSGSQGDPITVDLMSEEMDSYLYLVGPGYDEPFTDDDSGVACNARLNTFLPEDGPYLLVVGSLVGETGAYTLRVDNRGHPVSSDDCYGSDGGGDPEFEASLSALEIEGTIEIDVPLLDSLTASAAEIGDGSPARAWWYLGRTGETVTLDLISDDFDAMLFVLEEDGDGFWGDDDSGGGCNARVTLDVDSDEPYRIVVNSIGASQGSFTLRISTDPGPPSTDACLGM